MYNCDKWDKPPEKLYKISKAHKYFFNHVFAGFYWNSSDLKEIRKDQKSDIPNDLTKVKNLSIYKLKFRQLSYEVLNQIEEKEVCLARSEDIRRLNTSKLLNCRKFVKLAKAEIAQSQILETDWKNCQNQIQS